MIEQVFKNVQGKSVLFLGRLKHFTQEEVEIFLKQYHLAFSKEYHDDVAVVIESTMLNPLEEELSYTVYKEKIPTFRLDVFETLYAQKISPNSLLMSLKLSNDQERLIRLLKNEAFEKTLYLKLFKLYDWKGEGVHESDANRDVTTTFVKRFYNPDQFMDPAMIYSPITLMSIVAESEDPEVLDAFLSFPHYQIKVSKSDVKRPKTLKEIVALNPHASEDTLRQLSHLKQQDIDYFLAQNDHLPAILQEQIYNRANKDIKLMLAQNENLSDILFKQLLEEEAQIVQRLLVYQRIDQQRFDQACQSSEVALLGANETIAQMIPQLLEIDDILLHRHLAANPAVDSESLKQIYTQYEEKVTADLCSNPNLDPEMIKTFAAQKERAWELSLAANPATPTELLIAYFNQNDEELNLALASNEALPISYLQQFQLDPTLMNRLSKNRTFTENILNGLGI